MVAAVSALRLREPLIAAPRSGGDGSWLIHPIQGQAIEIAYRHTRERPHMMYTVGPARQR